MPEYLAPGVYIEEFESGARPMEGVSTSTAGFVGMTERGPVDRPTLITSFAEYQRKFGGYLDDSYGECRWLPYAVEGFFNNGGQRVYVTRVIASETRFKKDKEKTSIPANGFIPGYSDVTTYLARTIEKGSITLKVGNSEAFTEPGYLVLKDGALSEVVPFVGPVQELTLEAPLKSSFKKNAVLMKYEAGDGYSIAQVETAAEVLQLAEVGDLAPENIIAIVDRNSSILETGTIASVDGANKKITLTQPPHSSRSYWAKIQKLNAVIKAALKSNVKAGTRIIPLDPNDANAAFANGATVLLQEGNTSESATVTNSDREKIILIEGAFAYPHAGESNKEIKKLTPVLQVAAANEGSWGNGIRIVVRESSLGQTRLKSAAIDQPDIELLSLNGIERGSLLKIKKKEDDPGYFEYYKVADIVTVGDTGKVTLRNLNDGTAARFTGDKDIPVSTVEFDLIVRYKNIVEIFKNIAMDENHSRYFENIINERTSNLVRVKKAGGGSGRLEPTADMEPGWKLSNGSDGDRILYKNKKMIFVGEDSEEPKKRTGLYSLKNIDEISIVAMPGITDPDVQNELIIHCETLKNRFAVLDPVKGADIDGVKDQRNHFDSKFAALYYPWLNIMDPLTLRPGNIPPSGIICGIYARNDVERGVHKAPANEEINGVLGLETLNGAARIITQGQQNILDQSGINCIRDFPGYGIRVWGARTLSSNSLWKYVNVRRLFIYIESTIEKNTRWVVFEQNSENLRAQVRATITEFLTRVWHEGALMGEKPEEAFFVRCDRTTTTQNDIDNGRLVCVIGIAPVKPAEFVIFRIAQWRGGSAVAE